MKNIAALLLVFCLACFAQEDFTATKSYKALVMDGYEKDNLSTLRIQVKVGKTNLVEGPRTPGLVDELIPYVIEPKEPPKFTDEDKKNGYITFIRHYGYDVFPFSNPLESEIKKDKIEIFASRNEYEPIVFSICAIDELKDVAISIERDTLPKESFQINQVMNRPVGDLLVTVKGEMLKPSDSIPLIPAGICKTIWINVKIPENTAKGVFAGNILIKPKGKPEKKIKVEIRAFDFKLAEPSPDEANWAPMMAGSWDFEKQEKEFKILKEHGFTGEAAGCLVPEGDDFTKANKFMELAKKTGLPGKFINAYFHVQGTMDFNTTYGPGGSGDRFFNQEHYNELRDLAKKIQDNAVKNKWPPTILYCATEIGNLTTEGNGSEEGYKKAIAGIEQYFQTMHQVPGIKLLSTFNRPFQIAAQWQLPELDEVGANGDLTEEWITAAKGKPFWMTFVGNDQRAGYGWYLWKYNFKGARPWCLPSGIMYPREPGLEYYINKEMYPSVRMERIREGIDDYKYLYTYKKLVEKAGEKEKTEFAELEKRIMDFIPRTHRLDIPDFDTAKLDAFRKEIAERIEKLAGK